MSLKQDPIVERIASRPSTLGEGLTIHRALPTRQRRTVGAWCFLDHLGPIEFPAGEGLHVGAHPHTCLQTFTWMIEGEMHHRDSLGSEQIVRPGQVNLMTAGRGVAHTEDSVSPGQRLHAAQLWIALPRDMADCEPAFDHYPSLTQWQQAGHTFTLLVGRYERHMAPTRVYTPLLGMDIVADAAGTCTLALNPGFEHALLALEGEMQLGQEHFVQDELAYLAPGPDQVSLTLGAGSRVLLLGGEPLAEPILMWWNFVGYSQEEIRNAQVAWTSGDPRFGSVPGDGGRRLAAPAL
ncbi:MAG TPA: pirin family protein [Aquabacterium sp.]|uniref:pirin family protein n=1 Tax=Aquabacterium sp. TaxID=1872578 RepID=UPI002D88EFE9|nr:pirin family protein [Aquabacterium sp.]HET6789626.1 pirin family protein [Aquabacterium sp.]HEX5373618.1 pirin family protein [Aquabacterium sp.]